MSAELILRKASALGLTLAVVGDKIRCSPGSRVTSKYLDDLASHKQEIMAILANSQSEKPAEWHAEEVERLVLKEGYCLFWSHVFKEMVAFIMNDSFKHLVPAGIVSYTSDELQMLFPCDGEEINTNILRLIHQAKKLGHGKVTDVQ